MGGFNTIVGEINFLEGLHKAEPPKIISQPASSTSLIIFKSLSACAWVTILVMFDLSSYEACILVVVIET
jgi:hypothetical protein